MNVRWCGNRLVPYIDGAVPSNEPLADLPVNFRCTTVPVEKTRMKDMRLISLHQPWASLVVAGLKKYETRSWKTSWRGPLLIHATLNRMPLPSEPMLRRVLCPRPLGAYEALPRGAIIGMVELEDCAPTVQGAQWIVKLSLEERARGNFEPFRYGWRLSSPITLTEPLPYKGGLGMRGVPDELRELVNARLPKRGDA